MWLPPNDWLSAQRKSVVVVLMALLYRWLAFGWVGRLASLAAALFAVGWIASNLGLDALARQLGSAAIFTFSVLLVFLLFRQIWRDHTGPRYR